MPVVPSTTASTWQPTAEAITGVPHAIAWIEVIADGSYSLTLTNRSAERSSGGRAARPTSPAKNTRPDRSRESASLASRR